MPEVGEFAYVADRIVVGDLDALDVLVHVADVRAIGRGVHGLVIRELDVLGRKGDAVRESDILTQVERIREVVVRDLP